MFDIKGLNTLILDIDRDIVTTPVKLSNIAINTTTLLYAHATTNTPLEKQGRSKINTGDMRKAWQTERRGLYEYLLYNTMEYSAEAEYGHIGWLGVWVLGIFPLTKAIASTEPIFELELDRFMKELL